MKETIYHGQTLPDVQNAFSTGWQEITAALKAATVGSDLMVVAVPELRGAMVARCCVEVCVNTTMAGFNVECWHRFGSDPYKVVAVAALEDAVRLAMTELDSE